MKLLNELYVNYERAKQFAKRHHGSQVRKFTGELYVEHCIRTSKIIESYGKYFENDAVKCDLMIAAVLHDILEDTLVTYKMLKEEFGGHIASLVLEVTSDEKIVAKLGKTEYLKNKVLGMSKEALIIKLADRLDNVQGLSNASYEFYKSYAEETRSIFSDKDFSNRLSNEKNLVQLKLIREINMMLIFLKKNWEYKKEAEKSEERKVKIKDPEEKLNLTFKHMKTPAWANCNDVYFEVDLDNKMIAYIGLQDIDFKTGLCGNLCYKTLKEFREKGYSKRYLKEFIYSFNPFDFDLIKAVVDKSNVASVKMLEYCSFKKYSLKDRKDSYLFKLKRFD